MRRNRACDPCAARKAKCDRQLPCRRCKELSISCVTFRKQLKSGPKGPWAKKRYEAQAATGEGKETGGHLESLHSPTPTPATYDGSPPPPTVPLTLVVSSHIPISVLGRYLDIYQQELYPVWPVVSRDDLVSRLRDKTDIEAYVLATAISAVTIAQLNLPAEDALALPVSGLAMALESERARHEMDYRDNPSISVLLSSFFLHIASANTGKIHKATFLLREAITFAQILGLDKGSHFHRLCKQEAQLHLRIVWLLFITERGHTTRFDLPRTLQLESSIPELEVDEKPAVLFAFVSMCKLFQNFGLAMDERAQDGDQGFYVAMHKRLRETQENAQFSSNLQRADFLITQQWMRVVLWKMSLFHIELSASPAEESLSLRLPDQIARNVMGHLNTFPTHIVEAHGLGMEMKLFEIAISLADVLLCELTTPVNRQIMQVGPRDVLGRFVSYLRSFRGGDNGKMQILQQKLYDTASTIAPALDHIPIGRKLPSEDGEERRAEFQIL